LDPAFQCGKILVPLDHLNKTGTDAKISIAVSRYRPNYLSRRNKQSLGTIFVNPGGPGGGGVSLVQGMGPTIAKMAGDKYDILGFDPRGISDSNSVICAESASAHSRIDLIDATLQVPGLPGSPTNLYGFAAWQEAKAKACGIHSGDFLKYVSTAYTARDMDVMREALGEETLKYFGFSYGTFLGITYVNMFPERVGRVIIDGVTDPTTFSGRYIDWSKTSLVDMENVVDAFGKECEKAGPKRCALALDETTNPPPPSRPKPIATQIRNLLKYLFERPISVPDAAVPMTIGGYEAGSLLFAATYSPKIWPLVAQAFADLQYKENATLLASLLQNGETEFCPLKDDSGSFGFPAVKCNDGEGDNNVSLEEWQKAAEEVGVISDLAGRQWTFMGLACKYWPSRAVERYAGSWNKKLRNKVLLIGNTLDPVTPLASAQVAEKLMEGNGVLLTHEGYGHCSLAMPGKCTLNAIQQYFVHGILPEKGASCPTDTEAFPDPDKDFLTLSEDEKLMQNVKDAHDFLIREVRRFKPM
jgi:pimeloyl-ACP methyl ester carboxylesterase